MRAREVNRAIERLGGVHIRTKGSHKQYRVIVGEVTATTTVPQHSGDIPAGTLTAIERSLAPALGRKWLTK
ncbi:MAG: type II toxin-antitoxin system HicA family toxin [Promicromonosporaceae bacterium]|nr:type II toxin-antitoxin system HicA family toxin [Promicromonosporaceae bacterium]